MSRNFLPETHRQTGTFLLLNLLTPESQERQSQALQALQEHKPRVRLGRNRLGTVIVKRRSAPELKRANSKGYLYPLLFFSLVPVLEGQYERALLFFGLFLVLAGARWFLLHPKPLPPPGRLGPEGIFLSEDVESNSAFQPKPRELKKSHQPKRISS